MKQELNIADYGLSINGHVSEYGFVFKRGNTIEAFRWDQIEAMWQAVTKHYRNRAYVGTSHKYTVQRNDGVQIVFDNKFANIEQLGNTLRRQILKNLWPQMISTYKAGSPMAFGPFSISSQGVDNGKESLSWGEMTNMEVRYGRVMVHKAGRWQNWSPIMIRRIPNIFVFMALVNYALKNPA
ncbi:MAG: DUF6585 family protein [Ktedonobacteraceae bacterium]